MRSKNRLSHVGTSVATVMKGFALLTGLLTLLVSAGCGAGSTSTSRKGGGVGGAAAASISGTIAVGTRPSAIAVDSTTNKIYVADFGVTPQTEGVIGNQHCTQSGADVTTIDGATQSTTSVGFWFNSTPSATALNASAHTLYVIAEEYWNGVEGRGTCGQFGVNLEKFSATPLAQGGNYFDKGGTGVDVDAATGRVYVTRPGGEVVVWDSSLNLVATIAVGTKPAGVAVNATANKIYVANNGSNNVSVIDGATSSVINTITDPNAVAPSGLAVNLATNTIYVANTESNNVTVIDGATDSVTATIPVGTSPSGVAVDSRTNFIYVADAGNSTTGDAGNITVINGATQATSTLADPNAKNPVTVAANPVTNKIYVANSGSNNVTAIDGAHD